MVASVGLGITACSERPQEPATAQNALCVKASYLVKNFALPNKSGLADVADLGAAMSVYQTTWRLRAAGVLHAQLLNQKQKRAVKKQLLAAAISDRTSDSDPGLDELERQATAAIGLRSFKLSPAERLLVARAIDRYRRGPEYRLTPTDGPSQYATFIAVQGLHAVKAPVPSQVKSALQKRVASLPAATYANLDEEIVPRLGAYILAGGRPDRTRVNSATFRRWREVVRSQEQDGLALSLAANLHWMGDALGIRDTTAWRFDSLRASGGWSTSPGSDADAKATFWGTQLHLPAKQRNRFLNANRGSVGWLTNPGQPSIQSDYLSELIAAECKGAPNLDGSLLVSSLREMVINGASVIDVGRACFIERRRHKSIVPHDEVERQFEQLASKPMTFDEAVELRAASKMCRIAISKRVVLSNGGPSRYSSVGTAFIKPQAGWMGPAGPITAQPITLPKEYSLMQDEALKSRNAGKVDLFRKFLLKGEYYSISRNGRGDDADSFASPSAFTLAFMASLSGDTAETVLVGM